MLNASILQAGKSAEDDVNSALKSGFAGATFGAGVGLAAGALGFLADTTVDDVYYSFNLDVELRERPLDGEQNENASQTNTTKGTSTRVQSNVKHGKITSGSFIKRVS